MPYYTRISLYTLYFELLFTTYKYDDLILINSILYLWQNKNTKKTSRIKGKQNMLSELQKNKYTKRAQKETKKLLNKLNIAKLTNDTLCNLQEELYLLVASLVNAQEDGETIDDELLAIYDLLIDIIYDNEENLDFLNNLFYTENWLFT